MRTETHLWSGLTRFFGSQKLLFFCFFLSRTANHNNSSKFMRRLKCVHGCYFSSLLIIKWRCFGERGVLCISRVALWKNSSCDETVASLATEINMRLLTTHRISHESQVVIVRLKESKRVFAGSSLKCWQLKDEMNGAYLTIKGHFSCAVCCVLIFGVYIYIYILDLLQHISMEMLRAHWLLSCCLFTHRFIHVKQLNQTQNQ